MSQGFDDFFELGEVPDPIGFVVIPIEEDSFTNTGTKILRRVRQTNFKNAEAIGYLADRSEY